MRIGLAVRGLAILVLGFGTIVAAQEKGASGPQQEAAEQKAAEHTGKQLGDMVKAQKGKDIDAGLSWRVALLPFLGYRNLYDQFHHNEPWDSPHNRKLIPMMPKIYESSPGLPKGYTTFLGLVSDNSVITRETGGVRMSDIRDGASNTILCVSADRDQAVVWTRPKDIRFDPEHPLRGLGSRGYFLALFVDGSVHRIPATIDKETMRRLVYRNDGKPVSLGFME